MIKRAIDAALLNRRPYDELRTDPRAPVEAVGIVALVALSLWVAGVALAIIEGDSLGKRALAVLWIAPSVFAGWGMWTLLLYLTGGVLFRRGMVALPHLTSAVGFAHAPGILYVLVAIPEYGSVINLGILAWTLVAGVVAARATMRVSRLGAFWLSVSGIVLVLVVRGLLRF